jgi:hypothetical protein
MSDARTDLQKLRVGREQGSSVRAIQPTAEPHSNATVSGDVPKRPANISRRAALALATVVLAAMLVSAYALFSNASRKTNDNPSNSVAYDTYLHAKVLMSSENREDNESATKLLEGAVGTDPKFALAWTELARAYYIKAFYYTPEESKELNLKAEFAMRRRCRLILIWLKRTSFAGYSYGHMQTDFPTHRRLSHINGHSC